jgi:hypothetical protein
MVVILFVTPFLLVMPSIKCFPRHQWVQQIEAESAIHCSVWIDMGGSYSANSSCVKDSPKPKPRPCVIYNTTTLVR